MPFMRRIGLSWLIILLLFSTAIQAQDTLPRFSVTARGPGKILISWHNTYPDVNQISIQRSTDSLKNFSTLLTVPDPKLAANGVTDSKALHPNFYYRLFIVLDNGKYVFTPSLRPQANTTEPAADNNAGNSIGSMTSARIQFVDAHTGKEPKQIQSPSAIDRQRDSYLARTIYIRKGPSLIGQVSSDHILAFRDSLLRQTKDTLVFIDGDTIQIKPFIAKETYRISSYVFTNKFGNVQVQLPDAAQKHYSVKFFDENNQLLFELAEIKDPSLLVDKTNFHHSGWFRFELYDGDQLKEKNKLFIPREY